MAIKNENKKNRFGLRVDIDEKMPFEKAMRLFKRKMGDSDLLREIRERGEYTKPSTSRKLAKLRAIKRWQKKMNETVLDGRAKKY